MKKKSSPALTHVEIICLAIRAIAKHEALKSLYLMETGYEYN